MKQNKAFFFLIFILLFQTFTFTAGQNELSPQWDRSVYDSSGLLMAAEKLQINTVSRRLEQEIGSQIAVAVVSTTGEMPIEKYSLGMAEELGIGRAEYHDGILILLALDDRAVRIEVGYGLEKVITDDTAGRIIREIMTPYFSEGEYGKGLTDGVQEISSLIIANQELVGDLEGILSP